MNLTSLTDATEPIMSAARITRQRTGPLLIVGLFLTAASSVISLGGCATPESKDWAQSSPMIAPETRPDERLPVALGNLGETKAMMSRAPVPVALAHNWFHPRLVVLQPVKPDGH